MRSIIVLGLLSVASSAARDAGEIRKEYQQVKAAQATGWQQHGWDLAAEWAVAYLNAHLQATAGQLGEWMDSLDTTGADFCENAGKGELFDSIVGQPGPHVFVVGAGFRDCDVTLSEHGTFYLITERDDHYGVSWSLRNSPDKHLACWFASGFAPTPICVQPLPPTAGGHPRFWVEAPFMQGNGVERHAQLSAWEWDGAQLLLRAVREYNYVWSDDTLPCAARFERNLLHLQTKEPFHYLFVTFPEPESKGEWTVRVTPQGVEDLGLRKLQPELDLIDELYYRIANRRPSTDLASPSVIDELKKDSCIGKDCISGLMDWKLEGSKLCLAAESRHVFTVSRSGRKLFVTGIENAPYPELGESCTEILAKTLKEK